MTRYYGKQKKNNNWKLRNCKIVNPLNMFFIKLKTAVRYRFFNTNFLLKEPYQCLHEVSCASVGAILKHKCLTDLSGELVKLSIFPYNVSLVKKKMANFQLSAEVLSSKISRNGLCMNGSAKLVLFKVQMIDWSIWEKGYVFIRTIFHYFFTDSKKKKDSQFTAKVLFFKKGKNCTSV